MSVMFKTQQGRTLICEDCEIDSFATNIGYLIEIVGYEVGRMDGPLFHVNTRHVVEWWDPAAVAYRIEPLS